MAPMREPTRCRHCASVIKACRCDHWKDVHWQDAAAPAGLGNLHCPGEPHQRHEPATG